MATMPHDYRVLMTSNLRAAGKRWPLMQVNARLPRIGEIIAAKMAGWPP
jgi:hypothetical protein